MTSRLLLALVLSTIAARANPEFDVWIEAFTQEWVRADPMQGTLTQYLSPEEQRQLDRQLIAKEAHYQTPFSAAARAERTARAQRGLQQLGQFSRASLTPVQRVSADLFAWRMRDVLRTTEFFEHRHVFEQFRGLHIGLVNFLTQTHPIRNGRDVDNYLARLAQVPKVLDEGIAEARARSQRGFVPPAFILSATIAGIDRLLEPPPAQNVLVTTLVERAAKLGDYPNVQRNLAVATAERLVAGSVRPAFQRVKDFLVGLESRAGVHAGLWALPRGNEAYAAALATNTTTTLGADEIHAIGLREVTRIEAEMDKVLRQLGLTNGTVAARFAELQASVLGKASGDPRPAIIAEATRIVRDAEKRAEAIFDLRPKAPVEVQREPPFTEMGAAAHYSMPPPDGSKPAIYWLPLARLTPDVAWVGVGLKSVSYHEAVPGHHFQLALQQESTELPRFRRLTPYGFLSAYSEGWGLYAEQIADESGWYEGDPQGRLGYLNAQLLRARRLVVDTGLHAKRWTRQQAIDYGISVAEVERYIVLPGQACSYMIGQLRIIALRDKARAALGAKFSLKQFHNVILRTGAVPLDVLESVIDEWVAGNR